jgi:hypothetical protein
MLLTGYHGETVIVLQCELPDNYPKRKVYAVENSEVEFGKFYFLTLEESEIKATWKFALYQHQSFNPPNPNDHQTWKITNPVLEIEQVLPNHLFADYLIDKIASAISAELLELPSKDEPVSVVQEHWNKVINNTVDHLTGMDTHDERTH